MKENNNQVIYVVKAFYDMNINAEEEIIVECYATEELAQRRVRQLMRDFARDIGDADDYEEKKYSLFAYKDGEWNVDISYDIDVVRTKLDRP